MCRFCPLLFPGVGPSLPEEAAARVAAHPAPAVKEAVRFLLAAIDRWGLPSIPLNRKRKRGGGPQTRSSRHEVAGALWRASISSISRYGPRSSKSARDLRHRDMSTAHAPHSTENALRDLYKTTYAWSSKTGVLRMFGWSPQSLGARLLRRQWFRFEIRAPQIRDVEVRNALFGAHGHVGFTCGTITPVARARGARGAATSP